ncbi:MAG: putative lyase [Verrucomicrobiales bacterium]|nr:putative lyase [Verrucomicrobiales bacterium]
MRLKRFSLLTRIIVGCLVAGAVAFYWWAGPWYHGRTLNSWLLEYGEGPRNYRESPKADEALRHIGAAAVPHLLSLLHSTNFHTNYHLIRKVTVTSPPFVTWSNHYQADYSVHTPLADWIGKRTPFRVTRMIVPPSWDHWKAFVAFQSLGPAGKSAIPELLKLANNPTTTLNWRRFGDFNDLEEIAKSAMNSGSYVAPSESNSPGFDGPARSLNLYLVDGEIAMTALGAIGADAIPALLEMLADPNPVLQVRAQTALGMMGAAAEPAIPVLIQMAETEVPGQAIYVLGRIGKRPDLVVPVLLKKLKNPDSGAVQALSRFGRFSMEAAPYLLERFKQPHHDYLAGVALGHISHEITEKEVIPILIEEFHKPKNNLERMNSLTSLSVMDEEAELVIPILMEALEDSDIHSKEIALQGLGRFGQKAKVALDKVGILAGHTNEMVSVPAQKALRKIKSAR